MNDTDVAARLAERLADLTYRGRQMTGPEAASYARFLLPVVRDLQAEELVAAAEDFARDHNGAGGKLVALSLCARAAALRGEAGRG